MSDENGAPKPTLRSATRYQWLVLGVAWLGWVFDTMDGTLYSLVQKPAITELLGPTATQASVGFYSSVVFSATLVGWALGGLAFGVVADHAGRTRALTITILTYSLFTGASAIVQTWWQLALCRFITGIGLGGEWAAGAALVAEVWPDKLRARAASILQSAGAFGFFLAAFLTLKLAVISWRLVFVVGAFPAVVVFIIRRLVKEPDAWLEMKAQRAAPSRTGLWRETLLRIFKSDLRRDTLVATALAITVLVGLWGGTMWIPAALRELAAPEAAGMAPADAKRFLTEQASYGMMILNLGVLAGNLAFGPLADWIGRRLAFLVYLVAALIILPATFASGASRSTVFLLLPLCGAFTIGITSGFPIYLPELFPTNVRSTGVGFCYNVGRIVTAVGVFMTGYLVGALGSYMKAVAAIGTIYLLGIIIVPFIRETRGQRLTPN